jgi:hypothetical protein
VAIYTSGVICGSTSIITTLGGQNCATDNNGNWFNVMTASLKSNSSSSSTLFVSTALIAGLYTNLGFFSESDLFIPCGQR